MTRQDLINEFRYLNSYSCTPSEAWMNKEEYEQRMDYLKEKLKDAGYANSEQSRKAKTLT